MARKGDTKPPRSVEAQFDDKVHWAPRAGAVLFERLMRSMNIRRRINEHLPERPGFAAIPILPVAYSFLGGGADGRGGGGAEC